MTSPASEDAAAERAELLPEEIAAGSDDPQAQAEAILEESQERVNGLTSQQSSQSEQRSAEEASSSC
ncbi:hypothetical protein [Gephyromycinifex aptenodytis]|uniref:hypothetical protein n=1 Tax=Gephyromycinifex aptenodytis TaxID=2716227 RepID=UPI00144738F7|nr:hypothetical protein [Gephyromycinifex aptenodytis]